MRIFEAQSGSLRRHRAAFPGWRLVVCLLVILGFGGAIRSQPGVDNPRRIASGHDGSLLVSDRRHRSIVALDPTTLQPRWSFRLPGEGAPFGLARWERWIYVGNTESDNVEVYRVAEFRGKMRASRHRGSTDRPGPVRNRPSRERALLKFAFNLGGVPAGEKGFLEQPTDIALDGESGMVFVLDAARRKIEIFELRGDHAGGFFPVDRDGVLLSPVSLGVDHARQELLVGDYGDPRGSVAAATPARILIYGYDGTLRFQIDGDGSSHPATRFLRVQGLTVAADGRIFAADPLGGRILVLDRASGELLDELGEPGGQPGQLMLPLDLLLVEATGDLFVANNRGARRVEALRGAGR